MAAFRDPAYSAQRHPGEPPSRIAFTAELMSSPSASKAKPTCKLCRQRKVRCDGRTPCSRCSKARTRTVCEYEEPSSSSFIRAELPKGAACIPCREKKRRCDGNRPCKTCVSGQREDECKNLQTAPRNSPNPTTTTRSRSPTEESGAFAAFIEHATAQPLRGFDTPLAFTIPHSAAFFKVAASKSLHTHLFVSRDVVTELAFVRKLFLDQSWHFGLNISAAKRDAIARGDTTGAIAHPMYIPVAQLMGYMLANPNHTQRLLFHRHSSAAEAEQAEKVFAYLRKPDWDEKTGGRADPLTYVQVYRLLAAYCAIKKDHRGSQEFMGSASNLVLKYGHTWGIDDEESSSNPLPSVQMVDGISQPEEGRSALAYMVYIETVTRSILKFEKALRIPPVMLVKFTRIAARFDQETEINFLKAKTALFLVESQQLAKEWEDWQSGQFVATEWTERCRTLAHNITTHLLVVQRTQHELAQYGAPHGVLVSYCGCAIMSLASLAELYGIFAPFHPIPRTKHREIIDALVRIANTFNDQDKKYVDCTLDICWGIALRDIREQTPTHQWKLYMETVLFPMYLGAQLDI
ncbi:hypothetical protein C8F01DRAFT_1127983 [Mycena amicta]|nr:hypothetical protein C8F01DRAFT_1127983 [Mycena amicta]